MTVRKASDGDLEQLRAFHAERGAKYPLPDSPLAASYVCEADGKTVAWVVAVKAVEVVMVMDHGAETPAWRFEAVRRLQEAMEKDLTDQGYDCAYAWLEPTRGRGFGRKLMERLGWSKTLWDCYQRKAKRNV